MGMPNGLPQLVTEAADLEKESPLEILSAVCSQRILEVLSRNMDVIENGLYSQNTTFIGNMNQPLDRLGCPIPTRTQMCQGGPRCYDTPQSRAAVQWCDKPNDKPQCRTLYKAIPHMVYLGMHQWDTPHSWWLRKPHFLLINPNESHGQTPQKLVPFRVAWGIAKKRIDSRYPWRWKSAASVHPAAAVHLSLAHCRSHSFVGQTCCTLPFNTNRNPGGSATWNWRFGQQIMQMLHDFASESLVL